MKPNPMTNAWHLGRVKLFDYLPALALAIALAGLGFAVQGRIGFDLADEGFLWYGVQRVMAGEVPVRDFMSYDPGRYYFAAALMSLFGDGGVVALRAVSALVQAVGIFVGLMLLVRAMSRRDMVLLVIAAMTLAAWNFEAHKQYDRTTAIALLASLALLASRPARGNYFLAGLILGLAAVFGRNHGLYGAIGSVLVLLYQAIDRVEGRFRIHVPGEIRYWFAGGVVGYAPVLLMIFFVNGFASAFLDDLLHILRSGTTNIPLPVPWPWRLALSQVSFGEALRLVVYGSLFGLLMFCSVAGLLLLGWARWAGRALAPLLVGAICLLPGYLHYAFSRADEFHLAVAMPPLLIALLFILSTNRRSVALAGAATLFAISLLVTHSRHPIIEECRQSSFVSGCVSMTIGDDELKIRANIAQMIRVIRQWAAETPADRNLLVLPLWPGIYPVLGTTSPVWELYGVMPRSEEFQRREIQRIRAARPGMILLNNIALDNRPELTYSNTHRLITQYIVQNYVEVTRLGVYHLFRPAELIAAPAPVAR